ncbi:MAG: NAD(P)-dependent oxidoreductase [Bacteroidota bacterium]
MRILFIDTTHPILQSSLEDAGHECIAGFTLSREKILEVIRQYEGVIIRSRIQLDKEFLDKASQLKFIGRVGAGMESIDVKYAESKGIACINSPEGNKDAVGEHAIGMLLSLFNNLNKADREVKEGKWSRESNRGVELSGKTVGLIGYGVMGSAFAKKLSGFDCRVLAYDKFKKDFSDQYVKAVSMEEIFLETDVLSLHVPLSTETTFLVNDDYINRFRKNIYIINTARGKCLKTDDLVKNLQSGKVLGACLDTLEYEETSFEAVTGFKEHLNGLLEFSDKLMLSPHIAGWTKESTVKLAKVLAEKIIMKFPDQQ